MSTASPPNASPERPESPAIPTPPSGWLSQSGSLFAGADHDKRKRALGATLGSLAAHVLLVAIAAFLLTRPRAIQVYEERPLPIGTLVYLQPEEGLGGGGGGSPDPAPPEPMVIPETPQPEPEPPPLTPPPPVPPPEPPPPTMTVPVMTVGATAPQASGLSPDALKAGTGGGGQGRGMGSGTGDGVGPGQGTGFGGGIARPGAGITNPVLIRRVRPNYTSEAMRAKITGMVVLEAVVEKDGTVGDVRVMRSLDTVYGLDQEAIKAARQWVFRPATDRNGNPVPIVVALEIEFALH